MKKFVFVVFLSILSFGAMAQVENHLNNNDSPKETFYRATNKFSLNTPALVGGLTMGILKGNNANGNPGFLNLIENNYLFFGTNNMERVRILNTGQVGIGTPTPITLFDVNGQATVRSILLDSTLNRIVVADSNGTLFYRNASDFIGGGNGADNDWSGAGTGQMFATSLDDRVSIGTTSTTFKFEVVNDFINNNIGTAGRFRTNATGKSGEAGGVRGLIVNGNGNKIGVEGRSINNDNSTTSTNIGVRGSGEAVGSSVANTGVLAEAMGNSMLNIGVQAIVEPNAPIQMGLQATTRAGLSTIQNLGIRSIAQTVISGVSISENAGVKAEGWHSPGVINNYGLRAFAITSALGIPGTPAVNYGIFATASGSTTGVQRAGFFQGDVEVTGAFINPSDSKLKKNIKPYQGALNVISKLSPKTYNYKQDITNMNLPQNKQWGFIAQELQEVLPELVYDSRLPASMDDSGKEITPAMDYKSVSYIPLIPILVQAVKEQQNIIEKNQEEYELLKEELNSLKESINSNRLTNNITSLTLNKLEQNQPNPFNESTIIEYQLSDKISQAFIYIYNMNGKQLRKIAIKDQGKGKLTINSGELSPGMYIYTLMVDNKEVDTKKMIITD